MMETSNSSINFTLYKSLFYNDGHNMVISMFYYEILGGQNF